jgi:hypothetical protein
VVYRTRQARLGDPDTQAANSVKVGQDAGGTSVKSSSTSDADKGRVGNGTATECSSSFAMAGGWDGSVREREVAV